MKRDEQELTAYALGELSKQDAARVETWLAKDAGMRAFVDEVRATAAMLEQGFAREGGASLTAAQRAAIAAQAAERPITARPAARGGNWLALAAAAGVLGALGVWALAWESAGPADGFTYTLDGGLARLETPEVQHAREDVRQARASDAQQGLQGLGYDGGDASDILVLTDPNSESRPSGGFDPASVPPDGRVHFQDALVTQFDTAGVQVEELYAAAVPDSEVRLLTVQPPADQRGAVTQLGFERVPVIVEAETSYGLHYDKKLEAGGDVEFARAVISDAEADVRFDEVAPRWRYVKVDDVPTPGTEAYQHLVENTFQDPRSAPLSTFGVDVDSASYTNVRRFLMRGQLPPPDSVRVEEFVNYFRYGYPQPEGAHPFAVEAEVGACPWSPGHRLLRVGLQGKLPADGERKPVNLVFLLDTSGSMNQPNKLPLLQDSLRLMVEHLTENDSVAIVTYAGSSRLHLERTHGENRGALRAAIDTLSAGGSTNGEAGIQLAYEIASEGLIDGGINRVLLATDGDFNVGQSSDSEMERLIVDKAKSGVYLTVLGFGDGNLKDSKLEVISGKGNGQYAYIDGLREAKRVLVDGLAGTLETIAKDVKLQVDFNPAQVASYRLVGYENRALAAQDFTDDTKDAGDIGAGHRVTALYEIVPAGGVFRAGVEPSKYAEQPETRPASEGSGELCEVRLRYKQPDGATSSEFRVPVTDAGRGFEELSDDTRFAAAAAAFGMVLRGSPHRGCATIQTVAAWALGARGHDANGERLELCELIGKARQLGLR